MYKCLAVNLKYISLIFMLKVKPYASMITCISSRLNYSSTVGVWLIKVYKFCLLFKS